MLHYCLILVTDPLYLPLKRGGLVCPPLKSPVGSLCNYFIAHVFHLSIRTIGLFHPHGKICDHLPIRVQKNIPDSRKRLKAFSRVRFLELFNYQENP